MDFTCLMCGFFALIGSIRMAESSVCTTANCAWDLTQPEIRAYKAQGYQSCVRSLSTKAQQQIDCVKGVVSAVTTSKKCLCPSVPINRLLTAGLVEATRVKMHSMLACANYRDMMTSQTCPQDVKDCLQTAWSLHGSISMLRGQRHDGNCNAMQRTQVNKLTACIRDIRTTDLSGCGVWQRPIQGMAPIVNITLPLVCAGCNIQGLVRQCLAPRGRRPRPRTIPGPCQVKARTELIVSCLHAKMASVPICKPMVGAAKQAWASIQQISAFRAVDQACQLQKSYEAAATKLGCSTATPSRGKREVTWDDEDPMDIFKYWY